MDDILDMKRKYTSALLEKTITTENTEQGPKSAFYKKLKEIQQKREKEEVIYEFIKKSKMNKNQTSDEV